MADLSDNDKELLSRLLKDMDLEASQDRLTAQGITSVSSLRATLKDEGLRKHLQIALRDKGSTVAHRRLANWLETPNEGPPVVDKMEAALTSVDRTIALERVSPKADDALKSFLTKKGVGAELMPIFEQEGVTSISALQRVVANRDDSDTKNPFSVLASKLQAETPINGKIYGGSKQYADSLKSVSLQDLDNAPAATPPVDFRNTGLDTDAKNRYAQLKEAVTQVDALREKDAKAANALAKDVSSATKSRLAAILERVDATDLLKVFDGLPQASVGDLNTALGEISEKLSTSAATAFNAVAYKDGLDKFDPNTLATANCLKRGLLISATGIYECSGSDLVVVERCGLGTPGVYEEIVCDYQDENAYRFAERTIKESSNTYANSNSILGGFFTSSGIGAVSGAFQYATSTMNSEARAASGKTTSSVKVKERSIYAPKVVITLPREELRLSGTAEQYLKQIAVATDDKDRARYARLFLANFGGHVFRSVTLGGRYSYVARAEATSSATYEDVETALSEAQRKAGSVAGGFFGKFLLGGSSAHDSETTTTSAASMITTAGSKSMVVRVNIVVRGGLQEMPLEQWKQSLMRHDWWRVIDRREAVAVWDLLRTTSTIGLSSKQCDELAALLEKTWVQDVFVASLLESPMARFDRFASLLKTMDKSRDLINTVEELEGKLRGEVQKMVAPKMAICYLRFTSTKKSMGATMTIDLPPKWKILSGGGGAPDGGQAQVLVQSYPETKTVDGTQVWSWKLKTRTGPCVDGRCSDHGPKADEQLVQIDLVALYDPNSEWDVEIFPKKSSNQKSHDVHVDVDPGYVLTGGGVSIDVYGRPAVVSCGFVKTNGSALISRYGVATNNMEANGHHDDKGRLSDHSVTAYAIGIRARNRAALEPIYTESTIRDSRGVLGECHISDSFLHQRDHQDTPMLGGGVRVTSNRNYLSWSLPALSKDGRGEWKAYSADRAGWSSPPKTEMACVTMGLKNVDAKVDHYLRKGDQISTSLSSLSIAMPEFEDAFARWEQDPQACGK